MKQTPALLSITLILLVGLAQPARAAGPQSTILGVGTQSCGVWLRDEQSASVDRYINFAWVAGFLSAYNATGVSGSYDISKGTDMAGIAKWVSNYCSGHPLDSIAQAAAALTKELRKRGQ